MTELWFGDERGYNATTEEAVCSEGRCGLVMKEDITQHIRALLYTDGVVVW